MHKELHIENQCVNNSSFFTRSEFHTELFAKSKNVNNSLSFNLIEVTKNSTLEGKMYM